ncbi:MAG TPA: hypothetical protein VGG03_15660 [Thermoanaerobaculia bacterium]|jgi:hypothetical protein
MTRFKLMLLAAAVLMTTVAVRPAKSDACFIYGVCQSCSPTKSKPCRVVQCGTQKTTSCGSCTTNCVPPPD